MRAEVIKNQLWGGRKDVLARLIAELPRPANVLEIGTWFGLGSTRLFLSGLSEGSSLTCVDPWAPYARGADAKPGATIHAMDGAQEEAYASARAQLESYPHIRTSLRRGRSRAVLPLLPLRHYDLIYVDGSHYYDDVTSDLRLSLTLLRHGGILCGDDYELHATPERLAAAEQAGDVDYASVNGEMCHPGVMRAVAEVLGPVFMECGTFWTRYEPEVAP